MGKTCAVCGRTYEEILKTQKIGCAECYYAFAEEFRRTLRKFGIKGTYQGSFPKSLKGYKSTLTSRVELQFRLEDAVAKEEYEKAAFYRDYLRVLNREAFGNEAPSGGRSQGAGSEDVRFDTDSDSDPDFEGRLAGHGKK